MIHLLLFLLSASSLPAAQQSGHVEVSVSILDDVSLVGAPVYCWLRIANLSSQRIYIPTYSSDHGIEIYDESNNRLRFHGLIACGSDQYFLGLDPGETRVLRFDLQWEYDLGAVGSYVVRYRVDEETARRLAEGSKPPIPWSAVLQNPAIAPETRVTMVDEDRAVSSLLRERNKMRGHRSDKNLSYALHELADRVLAEYPSSPYVPAAEAEMVTLYLNGNFAGRGLSFRERALKAAEIVERLAKDKRSKGLAAGAASVLIESALGQKEWGIARSSIALLKRLYADAPPGDFARIKEKELLRGGSNASR